MLRFIVAILLSTVNGCGLSTVLINQWLIDWTLTCQFCLVFCPPVFWLCVFAEQSSAVPVRPVCWTVVRICIHSAARSEQKKVNVMLISFTFSAISYSRHGRLCVCPCVCAPVPHNSYFLWPPCGIGQAKMTQKIAIWASSHNFVGLYFCPVISIIFLLLLSFFPRLISAVGDWMSTILQRMVWP